MDVRDNELYLGGCRAEDLAREFGTPLYVYEEALVRRQCRRFRAAFAELKPDIHYAAKANPNPALAVQRVSTTASRRRGGKQAVFAPAEAMIEAMQIARRIANTIQDAMRAPASAK